MDIRNIFAGCIILGLTSVATPSFAKDYITQKEITVTQKGYLIKVANGLKFRILSVIPRKGKKTECKVHIPSVVREVKRLRARGGGSVGQKATVEIRARISSQGVPYCIGRGSGCTVTLAVEDTEN